MTFFQSSQANWSFVDHKQLGKPALVLALPSSNVNDTTCPHFISTFIAESHAEVLCVSISSTKVESRIELLTTLSGAMTKSLPHLVSPQHTALSLSRLHDAIKFNSRTIEKEKN